MNKKILPFAFCLLIFLTGCVRYDVGINFDDQHQGEIVQHIKLGQQLTALSQAEANNWLESVERRARQLQGKSQHISPQEIVVTIPFNNGQELATKFNQFFNPNPQKSPQSIKRDNLDLVQLNSELSLQQSNLLLLERNQLSLNVDLRALGVLSNQGNIIVSPGSLIDLDFILNTPWGAKNIINEVSLTPEIRNGGHQLVWHLQPGQINTIEAIFWLPSFLGLGTLIIVLLMLAGFYLKYKRFPWSKEPVITVPGTPSN
ncbi:MAG: DUF3153 domain-containing protein [Brasilonema sp.]